MKTGSYNSYGDENVAFATRIMIAERHYSAVAQTVVLPGGATANLDSVGANALLSTASGATKSRRASNSSHLRTRSVSSINGPAKPKGQEDFSKKISVTVLLHPSLFLLHPQMSEQLVWPCLRTRNRFLLDLPLALSMISSRRLMR